VVGAVESLSAGLPWKVFFEVVMCDVAYAHLICYEHAQKMLQKHTRDIVMFIARLPQAVFSLFYVA
jgi:hypothetical protein